MTKEPIKVFKFKNGDILEWNPNIRHSTKELLYIITAILNEEAVELVEKFEADGK